MTPDGAPPQDLPLTLSLDTVLTRCLIALAQDAAVPGDLQRVMAQALVTPDLKDAAHIATAQKLGLTPPEILVLHALIQCETDPKIAHAIGALQSGDAKHRPSAALLAQIGQSVDPAMDVQTLFCAPVFQLPLAHVMPSTSPAALSPVSLVPALLGALGLPGPMRLNKASNAQDIPKSWHAQAAALAARIKMEQVAIVVRAGLPADQQLYAAALAQAFGASMVNLPASSDVLGQVGLGAAITFAQALPVETLSIPAGTRITLSDLRGYVGPRLILADGAGGVVAPGWDVLDVTLPDLTADERADLWTIRLVTSDDPPPALAGLGPSRLAAISARMALEPGGMSDIDVALRRAAGAEARPDLEPHGQLVTAEIDDTALVASKTLQSGLDLLAARCVARRDSRKSLGPAFHARGHETGVRALLSGPSGGGKTMACAWLATRLGMPLFRVDLASVVSKYIGETEENLSRILDRAEAADVVLLFDEADSLFGARTDVKDSSDRFANNQTNFLLSRIESYSGIVLLTTNSRDRIDAAFARRIDQIIEVPVPDAKERRALWRAHLGQASGLSGLELNALATGADISGGHIRSIVGTAAVLANLCIKGGDAKINMPEIAQALDLEYRKIGRTPPANLVRV
ncbi:MAG: ATP-binding protein [Aliishimia sp.]